MNNAAGTNCITRRQFVGNGALAGLLAGGALNVPFSASAAQTEDPESAAIYYSELESRGRFSRLYDLMHPDARRLIPEEVVVGWYENEFAPKGPSVISVEAVDLGSWTWDVNEKTYRNAAEITYAQPFADGSVMQDVIHLVKRSGDWQWFFGPSKEFVDDQIALYADGNAEEDDAAQSDESRDQDDDSSRTSGTVSVEQLLEEPFRRSEEPTAMSFGSVTETSVGQHDGPMFGGLGDDLGATWLNVEVTTSIGGGWVWLQYAVFARATQAERAYERSDITSSIGEWPMGDETVFIEVGPSSPVEAILWLGSSVPPPRDNPATSPGIKTQSVIAGTVSREGNVLVLTYVGVSDHFFGAAVPLDPSLAIDPAYQLTVAAVEHVERIAR